MQNSSIHNNSVFTPQNSPKISPNTSFSSSPRVSEIKAEIKIVAAQTQARLEAPALHIDVSPTPLLARASAVASTRASPSTQRLQTESKSLEITAQDFDRRIFNDQAIILKFVAKYKNKEIKTTEEIAAYFCKNPIDFNQPIFLSKFLNPNFKNLPLATIKLLVKSGLNIDSEKFSHLIKKRIEISKLEFITIFTHTLELHLGGAVETDVFAEGLPDKMTDVCKFFGQHILSEKIRTMIINLFDSPESKNSIYNILADQKINQIAEDLEMGKQERIKNAEGQLKALSAHLKIKELAKLSAEYTGESLPQDFKQPPSPPKPDNCCAIL